MVTVVLRSVVFEVEEAAVERVRTEGLQKWFQAQDESGVELILRVYRILRLGLLVQELPEVEAEVVWEPHLVVRKVLKPVCKYHVELSSNEKTIYCVKPANTIAGYCSEHKRSALALYELCTKGFEWACIAVDQAWSGEDYVVYALDCGREKLKVGMTRAWRFRIRVAEQPHLAAAVLVSCRSALEARRAEKRLASKAGVTEVPGPREASIVEVVSRISSRPCWRRVAARFAEKLARLGVRGRVEAVSILPRSGTGWAAARSRAGLEELAGFELRVVDYGLGLLLLESKEGLRLVVPKKHLLHMSFEGEVY